MVGNEGEAGSLWPSAQVWVPQKVEKIEWWEAENSVLNGWGLGNWGILSDKCWMTKIEWRVMSDEILKTKQP